MRVEGLTIALRQRTSWEAVDLGVALVRRHARTIFASWLVASGLVFVLLNAVLLPFELGWLAAVLLWWLKPVFDRIPLQVLARAILGEAPSVRAVLRAQWRGAWRPIVPWLLWRRLHPARSMLLAVDLLEGLDGARRRERVRVLVKGDGSTPALLWVIGFHLEAMLWLSVIAFALMLVPIEFLSDSAKAIFDALVEHPPWWLQLLNNALYWLAMAVIEPIYVGAGFALYLNRRTQLEAWDVELAFRRLAARLAPGASAVLLLAAVLVAPALRAAPAPPVDAARDIAHGAAPGAAGAAPAGPNAAVDASPKGVDGCVATCGATDAGTRPGPADASSAATTAAAATAAIAAAAEDEKDAGDASRGERAAAAGNGNDDDTDEDEDEDDEHRDDDDAPVAALDELLPPSPGADDAGFARAIDAAMDDPSLSPKQAVSEWRRRDRTDAETPSATPAWLRAVGTFIGLVFEHILWILLVLMFVLLLANHRRWLPYLFGRGRVRAAGAAAPELTSRALAAPLPADIAAAVLALWRAGDARAALALLYRAALARLVEATGSPLPPGATEADALRLARRLSTHEFAPLLRRVVACWQRAAYAHRLPPDAELMALLDDWRASEVAA